MSRLSVLLLSLLLSATLVGQETDRRDPGDRFDRLRTAHRAFLTEELNLTAAEAERFFPLYWEREALHRRMRPPRLHPDTEEAALRTLRERARLRQQRLDAEIESYRLYLEVLPATKLVRLEAAETAFRRQLLQRARNRGRGRN